ncbi:hypothetical protein MPNT_320005 [Candidatus Methylacidithermus pantelleriae]|uniref:Uncharacterized protein n=1 Tax=Candidatus Methylacidithermus pantelleriae TaxID=2744239 RepID=A0A8J2BLN0_9BACT|nr:hypothetical protein MPNT_320005 [Candidatus Methylacidithermus pantelleriae]
MHGINIDSPNGPDNRVGSPVRESLQCVGGFRKKQSGKEFVQEVNEKEACQGLSNMDVQACSWQYISLDLSTWAKRQGVWCRSGCGGAFARSRRIVANWEAHCSCGLFATRWGGLLRAGVQAPTKKSGLRQQVGLGSPGFVSSKQLRIVEAVKVVSSE